MLYLPVFSNWGENWRRDSSYTTTFKTTFEFHCILPVTSSFTLLPGTFPIRSLKQGISLSLLSEIYRVVTKTWGSSALVCLVKSLTGAYRQLWYKLSPIMPGRLKIRWHVCFDLWWVSTRIKQSTLLGPWETFLSFVGIIGSTLGCSQNGVRTIISRIRATQL